MENEDDWLAPDKFQHVLFSFSITVIFSILATRAPHPFLRRRSLLIGSIVSLAAGAAKEIADEFGFFRSAGASAKDAVADLLGILIAVFALYLFKSLFSRVIPDQTGQLRGLQIV